MGILRNKFKDRFVQVPNALVTDTSVSMPARLVYVYLASKPDGWTVRNADVKKSLGIKDDNTLAKYWKELSAAGWIIRKKCLPGVNAGTYEYELWDTPKTGNHPNMGKSQIWENPKYGKNPEYNNTDLTSNTDFDSNTENINTSFSDDFDPDDVFGTPSKPVNNSNQAVNNSNITAELKQRINKLYNRRESTTWSNKELTVLRQIAKRNGVLDEMTAIENLYNSGYEYRRRGVQTFLNNWCIELDRANNNQTNNRSNNDATSGSYGRYVPKN